MFSFQTPGPTPRIPSLHTASTRPQSPHQPKIAYVTTLMNFRSFSEGLQVAPAPVRALGTSLSPESMEHRPSERSVPPCILQTLRIARSNFPPLETDEESTLRSYFDPKPTLANPIFRFSRFFFRIGKSVVNIRVTGVLCPQTSLSFSGSRQAGAQPPSRTEQPTQLFLVFFRYLGGIAGFPNPTCSIKNNKK